MLDANGFVRYVQDMRKYSVTIPFAGSVTLTVNAENEDDAIKAALEHDDLHVNNCDEVVIYQRSLVRGNVCSAPVREAFAEDLGPADGDE